MFLREISELETFFKTLDRLNVLVFNVWHDKTAESYKNGDMHLLESFYRTYISEMRDLVNELTMLQKQIEEEKQEIGNLEREILNMKKNPSIQGCYKAHIAGRINEYEALVEPFALAADEISQMEELAYERAREINYIDGVSLVGPL